MNKRASIELVILGLVAVIALVGLVMLFTGSTGKAAGQPMTRQVLPTEEELKIERPGGYSCSCTATCVYDRAQVSAMNPITRSQPEAVANCRKTLENRCKPQPMVDFNYNCDSR
jgi:hypothetical protein